MPNIEEKIEAFLDKELGAASDDLPWREELLGHLSDTYADCLAKGLSPEEAWEHTAKRFGDAQEIGEELEKIHTPNALEWLGRTLAVGIALFFCLLFTREASPVGFLDIRSALFILIPAALGLFSLGLPRLVLRPGGALEILRSRDLGWEKLQSFIGWGAVAGLIVGSILTAFTTDPSHMGQFMALALLCSLYGLILTRYPTSVLVLISVLCLSQWVWLFRAFEVSPLVGQVWNWSVIESSLVATLFTFLFGFLYYGRIAFLRRFHQLPVIAMIVASVFFLQRIENPNALLVGFFAAASPLLLCLIP